MAATPAKFASPFTSGKIKGMSGAPVTDDGTKSAGGKAPKPKVAPKAGRK